MSRTEQPLPNKNADLETSFIRLFSGKKVIILPNDPPSKSQQDDYIIICTASVAAIENMSIPDLLVHYANILAIEAKVTRYTGPQWDALIDGLDTLRICSELFSTASTNELSKIVNYIYGLSTRHQSTLFTVLAVVFETRDWMRFERRALKKEEFEISAVVWVVKIGPRGLALGRSKGKTELETLLVAEEAWLAANQDAVGYKTRRGMLEQFAAGLVGWDKTAEGLFGV